MIRWLVGSAFLLIVVSALTWFVVLAPAMQHDVEVSEPRTLGVDANALESIEIRRAGDAGSVTRLLRSGLTGGMPAWLIRETTNLPVSTDPAMDQPVDVQAGEQMAADALASAEQAPLQEPAVSPMDWPADTDRVRAAIRVLQTAQIVPLGLGADSDSSADTPLATLTIAQRSGDITIEFLDRPLMGRARVRVLAADGSVMVGTVESAFFDAIAQTGPAAWGSAFLLQPAASGPSRMSIETADPDAGMTGIHFARRADRWRLIRPFAAPASPESVSAVLGALGRARVEGEALARAAPGSGGTASGSAQFPGQPAAVLTLEADRPATGQTWTQRIEIGDLASLGGESILVRVTSSLGTRTLWGPRVLEVPAETFDAINPRADAYISATPSDLIVEGVAGIRLIPIGVGLDGLATNTGPGAREYRKYGNEWVEMYGDARTPVPGSVAEALAGVIRAVTTGVATRINEAENRAVTSTDIVRLVLLDPLYQPAQVFEISVHPDDAGGGSVGGALNIAAGGLRWVLQVTAEADREHLLWLANTIEEASGTASDAAIETQSDSDAEDDTAEPASDITDESGL